MRYIIVILIVYLAYKFLKALFRTKENSYQEVPIQPRQASIGDDLVEDPHCHTYIPLSDAHKASVNGKTIYFCSKKCLNEFTGNSKTET